MNDKLVEKDRYNNSAKKLIKSKRFDNKNRFSEVFSAPYICYQEAILNHSKRSDSILEIGSGTGENTGAILETGAQVCASDISDKSLIALKNRYQSKNLRVAVEDMEALSFNDNSFDMVCCAGSLSYGDNMIVMDEIYRITKHGGCVIIMDSLNNNPIYRFNRYIHYLRGNRSRSTLLRMPTVSLIDEYTKKFGCAKVEYYGSIIWFFPLLVKIFPKPIVTKFSDWLDAKINIKKSAFKFVMTLVKK